SSLRGAEVSFGCGVLASGKALVFNRDSRRHLITAPLDSSQARYLQFTLRLGSRSILSSCPAPDKPGEGVLLHYSSDNGITWTLLQHYAYQGFHEIVSVELPAGARKFGVQFRWWQPYHSGRGHDVWALDEISMTSVLFNTISLDFSNVLDVTQSLGFYLGHVQPYCQHDWTLSREEGVLLQYSNDGGISWGLIAEMYFTDFTKPRFVHYELPLASKTPSTRFRWWQPLHSGEGYDQWAIDDVIILSEREKHIIPMANPTLPQVKNPNIFHKSFYYIILTAALGFCCHYYRRISN
uniref:Reelin n=1 Tax=Oryzias latipes TaxID=8090 RepID=A0A3B3IM24_ORYLA